MKALMAKTRKLPQAFESTLGVYKKVPRRIAAGDLL